MTEEEIIEDLSRQYKLLSNSEYRREILNSISSEELIDILVWKKQELQEEINMLKEESKRFRWESRELLISLSEDRQKEFNKLIKFLKFQLDLRNPLYIPKNDISIEELKTRMDIVTLIEILTWSSINNTRRLIQCPLKWHNDNTPSFKIYENTDTFYCPWCMRWWDQISFVEHFFWISKKESILKFKNIVWK